jgi:hypothetical protein
LRLAGTACAGVIYNKTPEIAQFKFRAHNQRDTGGHNQATIDTLYGACQEMSHREPFVSDADEPPVLLFDFEDPQPPSAVLVLLTKMEISSSHSVMVAAISSPVTMRLRETFLSQVIVSLSSLREIFILWRGSGPDQLSRDMIPRPGVRQGFHHIDNRHRKIYQPLFQLLR